MLYLVYERTFNNSEYERHGKLYNTETAYSACLRYIDDFGEAFTELLAVALPEKADKSQFLDFYKLKKEIHWHAEIPCFRIL